MIRQDSLNFIEIQLQAKMQVPQSSGAQRKKWRRRNFSLSPGESPVTSEETPAPIEIYETGWWFQIFFMFTPTWGNDPI